MIDDWPFPHQNAAPPEIVHAVGQLIMNWNYAEHGLQTLAQSIFQINGIYSNALLVHIGSGTLVDAIRAVLPFRNLRTSTASHIDDGLAWFLELRSERNKFVHSIYHPSMASPGLRRIGASSKGGKLKFREERLELNQVRSLAEEIFDLGAYLIASSKHLETDRDLPHDLGTRKFVPRRKNHSRSQCQTKDRATRRKPNNQ